MELLISIEKKGKVQELASCLLSCPVEDSNRLSAAQQLRDVLHERGFDLSAAFAALDADGSGSINHREFKDGLQSLGVSLPSPQIQELIAVFDADGDGAIEYREFIAEFAAKPEDMLRTLCRLQSKFTTVDTDFASGELKSAFAELDCDRQ